MTINLQNPDVMLFISIFFTIMFALGIVGCSHHVNRIVNWNNVHRSEMKPIAGFVASGAIFTIFFILILSLSIDLVQNKIHPQQNTTQIMTKERRIIP